MEPIETGGTLGPRSDLDVSNNPVRGSYCGFPVEFVTGILSHSRFKTAYSRYITPHRISLSHHTGLQKNGAQTRMQVGRISTAPKILDRNIPDDKNIWTMSDECIC